MGDDEAGEILPRRDGGGREEPATKGDPVVSLKGNVHSRHDCWLLSQGISESSLKETARLSFCAPLTLNDKEEVHKGICTHLPLYTLDTQTPAYPAKFESEPHP